MALFERLSLAQRSLIPSLAGFLFYGTWAFLVNITHGPFMSARAALVQGSYSFVITLGMTLMLEASYRFLSKTTGLYRTSAVISVVLCCTPVFVGSWLINVAAGTPEVFRTVILGYIIGCLYSSTYVIGLLKHEKKLATAKNS